MLLKYELLALDLIGFQIEKYLKRFEKKRKQLRFQEHQGFSGIGVSRPTGTAVTLFCGDPSMSFSE